MIDFWISLAPAQIATTRRTKWRPAQPRIFSVEAAGPGSWT